MGAEDHRDAAAGLALIAGKRMEAAEEGGSHGLLPRLVLDSYGDSTRVQVSPISRRIGGGAVTTQG